MEMDHQHFGVNDDKRMEWLVVFMDIITKAYEDIRLRYSCCLCIGDGRSSGGTRVLFDSIVILYL